MGADHQGVRRASGLTKSWIMSSHFRVATAAFVTILALSATGAALAQSYPDRPIRLVAAFPPGGANDLLARLVAQSLSPRVGQPVVVENRPGSNGNVAGDFVAHAAPDGYTLLVGPSALFDINPHLYAHMSIDPLKDLLPVATSGIRLAVAGRKYRACAEKLCRLHRLCAAGTTAAAVRINRQRQRPSDGDGVAQAASRHTDDPCALSRRWARGASASWPVKSPLCSAAARSERW